MTHIQFVVGVQQWPVKGKQSTNKTRAFKDRICMSNLFAAKFAKFFQEIKKLYAFEVSIMTYGCRHICEFMTS